VHVRSRLPYTEIESFIRDTIKRFVPINISISHIYSSYNNLELIEFDGPIKSALVNLKSHRPNIIPIFIGSRSTDNTTTTSLAWTDPDWPRYLRVSPLVHWRYADIWRLLRDLSIPYCILYDRGFTSIGDRERTRPNAALRYTDAGGIERYLPAYTLVDETLERAGRQ
jgi:FAD synthetase